MNMNTHGLGTFDEGKIAAFEGIGDGMSGVGLSEGLILGGILVFMLLALLFIIAVATWLYRDAESRGQSGLLWLFLALIGGFITIVIWFLIRNSLRPRDRTYGPAGRYGPHGYQHMGNDHQGYQHMGNDHQGYDGQGHVDGGYHHPGHMNGNHEQGCRSCMDEFTRCQTGPSPPVPGGPYHDQPPQYPY